MLEHKENPKNQEQSVVSVHASLKPEVRSHVNHKPFNLPPSPEEEYFESIGEQDLFINLDFAQRFALTDDIRSDPDLLADWNANKNTFNLLVKNGCTLKEISVAFYKQINDPINQIVPFGYNETKWSKHWWGVKIRMSYSNYKTLYDLNFQGLISKLAGFFTGPVGTILSVIATVIWLIMEVLNYLNERDKRGIWVNFFWNALPWRWGSQ